MKHKLKTILNIAVVILIGFWVLSKIPFNQKINQEISADIYENGVVTDQTTVIIEGEKSNYLFREDENFGGKVTVTSYEKSGRKDMQAGIYWREDENVQNLLYSQSGGFPEMEILSTIFISDDMTKFAFMFTDGSVVATSKEVYQLYIKYVSYDSEEGVTSISGVDKIPKL